MDLGVLPTNKHILDWDESDVHQWFRSIGYPQYEAQVKAHKIRGDSLCVVDSEGLKSLGIVSIGQRLSILKAIYHVKLAQNMTFDDEDYIPPSEAPEREIDISPEKLHTVVKDQAQRIRVLEEQYRQMSQTNRSFHEAIAQVRATLGLPPVPELIRSPLAWIRSPTDSEQLPSPIPTPSETPAASLVDSSDANITKVGLEDPTSKVLPAALRKNKIKEEEWGDYAMFITYGPPGKRTKRRLELDEKPLFLFKKLRDANQNPAFVLKNIKDLRSPVELEN
jgi:protein STE50